MRILSLIMVAVVLSGCATKNDVARTTAVMEQVRAEDVFVMEASNKDKGITISGVGSLTVRQILDPLYAPDTVAEAISGDTADAIKTVGPALLAYGMVKASPAPTVVEQPAPVIVQPSYPPVQ